MGWHVGSAFEVVKVRRATTSDAPAMAALLGQLGYPSSVEVLPSRVDAIEREGGAVYVATAADDRILGLASAARLATLHAGAQVAYITALVTADDARGQGVGRAMVATIEQWARDCGCTRLSVTSAERRADAHAFYPRCGMPYNGRRFSKQLDAES
ncbi:MAG: GCN5-related N-acetyltransferase [Gemmatimonadetes bacterium]|jgi:GNAT superfamily N-acetyltransferase|nr:GCN5-related N-acetyltransferase [Gemmatimonadota bacterium]